MRRQLATTLLSLALSAPALAGPNETFRIEPDARQTHGCSLGRTFVEIEAATLTKRSGTKTDATPGSCSTGGGCVAGGALVAIAIVDDANCTDCVIEFEIDPDAGGTDRDGNGYQFHGRGRDANGHRWTCNGPVLIRAERVEF